MALNATRPNLLSKRRTWQVALSLTVANFSVNQGDTYTFLDSDFTGIGDDFHHYVVTTLPTHGTLYKSGVALALNGTFTEADLTAGLITYVNDGLAGTDDSMATKDHDSTSGISAAAATTTITVTDGSWLLTYVESGLPSLATRFSTKAVSAAQEARLEAALGGIGTTVFLPAALVTGLPLNYFHAVDTLIASAPAVTTARTNETNNQANKLLAILNRAENSDLKTLVNTWGAALELEATGRATLDDSLRARWRNIKQEVEQVPATFQREFPFHTWWAVLDTTAALI